MPGGAYLRPLDRCFLPAGRGSCRRPAGEDSSVRMFPPRGRILLIWLLVSFPASERQAGRNARVIATQTQSHPGSRLLRRRSKDGTRLKPLPPCYARPWHLDRPISTLRSQLYGSLCARRDAPELHPPQVATHPRVQWLCRVRLYHAQHPQLRFSPLGKPSVPDLPIGKCGPVPSLGFCMLTRRSREKIVVSTCAGTL